MEKDKFQKGEIIIYKTSKNEVCLDVRLEEETVWLRQNEIADLFGKDRSVIARHIKAIFHDQEVDKKCNSSKKEENIKIQYVPFWNRLP